MVEGAKDPPKGQLGVTSTPDDVDKTYENDDWFDLEKYKDASKVAFDYSIWKIQEAAKQERETIGKGADEERATNRQKQQFSEKDEERDYKQSQKGYRF